MNASGTEEMNALIRRICGEYMEMPGLRLSAPQAERLWGLDADTCAALLEFLVDLKFLHRAADGRFARLNDGGLREAPLRMIKATLDPLPEAALSHRKPPAA